MEPDIGSKMKDILQPVVADFPGFGNAGHRNQETVQLDQAVEQLVAGPNVGLVAGICRVQRSDTRCFIVSEDAAVVLFFLCRIAGEKKPCQENHGQAVKSHVQM